MQTGIRLIGNGQAPVHRYWEHLLDLVRKNEIKPLRMLTHRILLDDMEKLYPMFEKRENGIQKVFVATKFSSPPCAGSPELVNLWRVVYIAIVLVALYITSLKKPYR